MRQVFVYLIIQLVHQIRAVLDASVIQVNVFEVVWNSIGLYFPNFIAIQNRVNKFDNIARPQVSPIQDVLVFRLMSRHLFRFIEYLVPFWIVAQNCFESLFHKCFKCLIGAGCIPFD